MKKTVTLISILNWNSSDKTLECVHSIRADECDEIKRAKILVIDNGSEARDFENLRSGLADINVELHRVDENLGFTGGHNIALKMAEEQGFDFVWLLNNDTVLQAGVLTELLLLMHNNPACGAASPVIRASHDPDEIDACGAFHDWANRASIKASSIGEIEKFQTDQPAQVWIPGTAILLRASALKAVGGLDDRLFAYFDDNDICARLSAAGWLCQVATNASVLHDCYNGLVSDRPAYYFYLMQRNEMMFWYKNTPKRYRRFLWLKILDHGLFNVNRLYAKKLDKKADAAALGLMDFILDKTGRPGPVRNIPAFLSLVLLMNRCFNRKHLANV